MRFRPSGSGSSRLSRWVAVLLLGACGGAQQGAPGPKPAEGDATSATQPHAPPDADDTLAQFQSKLSGGLGGESELRLAAKGWGPALGRVLGESAALEALNALDVSDNELGVEGAQALARSSHLTALRSLDLGGNDIGDAGAIAISKAMSLAGLE